MDTHAKSGGWSDRLAHWFPDREFFMRSQGQVRFIKVSSSLQKWAAGAVVAALAIWAVSMAVMGWTQYRNHADRLSLLQREAKVAKSEDRFDKYANEIDNVADDLKKRQDFIEAMTDSLPADVKGKGTVTDSDAETKETVEKVSALFPQAGALAQVEARQIAYVERLTRYADRRASRTANALRKLGLNPASFLDGEGREAMGGPLELLSASSNGEIDERFQRLGLSLARMEALERGLDSVPQYRPTNVEMVTSSYGYRRDPFTGVGAMHSGLDFRGPTGAPIHAAAKGVVTFVGWRGGYGNTVEIDHGNGLMTRYAHMSREYARPGQAVEPGDVIGAIGSTGRSTGPHLHFEVRINNRAVNPRLFLEQAPSVLKEARSPAPRGASSSSGR